MKKLAVLLLAACVALGGAGCKNSVSDTVSGLVEDAGTAIQADGREYGQTYTFESGELVETAFFNFQVNEVSTAAEIEGYVPEDETNQLLILGAGLDSAQKMWTATAAGLKWARATVWSASSRMSIPFPWNPRDGSRRRLTAR